MQFTTEQQQYIDEHYQLLPVDADGVPIHVGDVLMWADSGPFEVCGINKDSVWFDGSYKEWVAAWANVCHHVKPDPLKELLNEHLQEREKIVRKLESSMITLGEAKDEEDACDKLFAERIRELLGGDAE